MLGLIVLRCLACHAILKNVCFCCLLLVVTCEKYCTVLYTTFKRVSHKGSKEDQNFLKPWPLSYPYLFGSQGEQQCCFVEDTHTQQIRKYNLITLT